MKHDMQINGHEFIYLFILSEREYEREWRVFIYLFILSERERV